MSHVLVFADHGEAFGENDVFAHGRSLDTAETRVPLLWRLPGGLHAGERVATTVELADIVPTLTRLLGVTPRQRSTDAISRARCSTRHCATTGFAFTQARFLHSMGVRGPALCRPHARPYALAGRRLRVPGRVRSPRDPDEERMRRLHTAPRRYAARDLARPRTRDAGELARPAAYGAIDHEQLDRLRALGYVH